MSAEVFISYASQDREQVRPMVKALEAAHFSVWWDREIGAGAKFERQIEAALDAAKCVIVVWSQNAVQSDWVRAEAHEGLSRGVLAPVIIDDARPPLAFRQTQHIRIEDDYSTLIDEVRAIVEQHKSQKDLLPHIHYVKTPDNVRLAYIKQGTGHTVVRSLGWSTCCELDLNGENALTNELINDFRFITYDGRGGGMSQRGKFDWSIEDRMCDLGAVIDDAQIDGKFALFGISEGCRAAILYANENPDRVSHLILDSPALPFIERQAEYLEEMGWFPDFIAAHWGTHNQAASRMICAIWSQSATAHERKVFMERQRKSMPADVAADYIAKTGMQNLDRAFSKRVWAAIEDLQTPTLIFHAIEDPLAPYELAAKFAQTAPNAELITSTLPDHGSVLSAAWARQQAREVKRFVLGR